MVVVIVEVDVVEVKVVAAPVDVEVVLASVEVDSVVVDAVVVDTVVVDVWRVCRWVLPPVRLLLVGSGPLRFQATGPVPRDPAVGPDPMGWLRWCVPRDGAS